jgi:hypothetical protein
MERTSVGWRVNWEPSRVKWKASEEKAFREAHNLVDAALVLDIVGRKLSFNEKTEVSFKIVNQSGARINFAMIEAVAAAQDDTFIGQGNIFVSALEPRDSAVVQKYFDGLPVDCKWKFRCVGLQIGGESGRIDAVEYFSVESKPK